MSSSLSITYAGQHATASVTVHVASMRCLCSLFYSAGVAVPAADGGPLRPGPAASRPAVERQQPRYDVSSGQT
jgi:hypothetical protein